MKSTDPGRRSAWRAVVAVVLASIFSSQQDASAVGRARPIPQTPPIQGPAVSLMRPIFSGTPIDDQDFDCIPDDLEHVIAKFFRPLWVFDSHEQHRENDEPATFYQIHSGMNRRLGCDKIPQTIIAKFSHVYRRDGGFTTSVVCDGAHTGDNQALKIDLRVSDNGRTLEFNGLNFGSSYDPSRLQLYQNRHPIIYLSAGKHHEYIDTSFNGKGYKGFCREGVDGLGDQILAVIEDPRAPRGWMNVGERNYHPPTHFAADMDAFGYPGEHTWDNRQFCGGYSRTYCTKDSTAPMSALWE
jgi:hypothetical protein